MCPMFTERSLPNMLRVWLLGFALAGVAATAANAITITMDNGGGNPSDQVLFNSATDTTFGTLINGHLQNPDIHVYYYGALNGTTINLLGSGGQSEVTNGDNSNSGFTSLNWYLQSPYSWNDERFNLDTLNNAAAVVTFTYIGNFGTYTTGPFDLGTGSNWFNVDATGQQIYSASLTITSGALHDFQQDRIGVNVVPLPAALPLFATGLGALGLLGWRRKRKNAAALAA
jgi:hypothetical protein